MAYEIFDQEIYFGRSGQPWSGVQDFYVDPNDFAVKMRKVQIQDIGDPPDLGLGRAGPDGAPFDHRSPEAVQPGQNLGTIYWRGYEGPEIGWGRRSAQIYARYHEQASGSLHLATANNWDANTGRPEDGAMRDRVIIEPDGTLNLEGVPFDEHGRFRVRLPDGRIGWVQVTVE